MREESSCISDQEIEEYIEWDCLPLQLSEDRKRFFRQVLKSPIAYNYCKLQDSFTEREELFLEFCQKWRESKGDAGKAFFVVGVEEENWKNWLERVRQGEKISELNPIEIKEREFFRNYSINELDQFVGYTPIELPNLSIESLLAAWAVLLEKSSKNSDLAKRYIGTLEYFGWDNDAARLKEILQTSKKDDPLCQIAEYAKCFHYY